MAKFRSYESDITRLLRDLLDAHPEIAEAQRDGRSMWWDRTLDAEAERAFRAAAVPQKPYVYDCGPIPQPTVTPPSP
jgi:hypothetical protein